MGEKIGRVMDKEEHKITCVLVAWGHSGGWQVGAWGGGGGV